MGPFIETTDTDINNIIKEPQFSELWQANQNRITELLEAKIGEDDSPDEVRIKARKFALQHLPVALDCIAALVTGAEKETTQLSAAKLIWAIASSTTTRDDEDPIGELFKAISSP